jgi:hypothetical protein
VFKRTQLLCRLNPKELQDLLDELKASRISRKTAWDILQECILNEHGVILAAACRKEYRRPILPRMCIPFYSKAAAISF